MRIKSYLPLIIAGYLLLQCSGGSYHDSVSYQLAYFDKKYGDCDSLSTNCVKISAAYPVFTQAANRSVLDSLNKLVRKLIIDSVFESKPKSFEELSDVIITDYKKMKTQFPNSPIKYELDRTINVMFNQEGIVSIEFIEYSFLGGAHPNSVRTFFNIDSETGKEIKMNDLFIMGYEEKLYRIGEMNFREVRNLKPEDDLEKSGFWFTGNKFSLNQNFSVTKSGLIFYFNDYEIAPHSMAPTEVFIKYEQIKDLLNKEGILANLSE